MMWNPPNKVNKYVVDNFSQNDVEKIGLGLSNVKNTTFLVYFVNDNTYEELFETKKEP